MILPFAVVRTAFWERHMGYLGGPKLGGQVAVIEWQGVRA